MESARRRIHVLMSTGGEQGITKSLTALFNKRLGTQCDFQVCEIPYARKFLEYAEREQVDLFLVVLNNIFPDVQDLFPPSSKVSQYPGSFKVDQALQIVSYLKQKYHKPVLALTGWWPDDKDIAGEVRGAELDYFGDLPPDNDRLVEVMRTCLEYPQKS